MMVRSFSFGFQRMLACPKEASHGAFGPRLYIRINWDISK